MSFTVSTKRGSPIPYSEAKKREEVGRGQFVFRDGKRWWISRRGNPHVVVEG